MQKKHLFQDLVSFSCLVLALLLPMLGCVIIDVAFLADVVREATDSADKIIGDFREKFLYCVIGFSCLAILLPILDYVTRREEMFSWLVRWNPLSSRYSLTETTPH